jgi:6,7-dimethyl-8-ribityllumazine synthase
MASSAPQAQFDPGQLPDGKGLHIGVVTARWNEEITYALRDACLATLKAAGLEEDDIYSIEVPGAFELPMGARLLLEHRLPDAVICLGCVIKGETRHDQYIADAVARGLMDLGLRRGVPVMFGLLTTEDEQQARERAGGKHGNKGAEAAISALQMARLGRELAESSEEFPGGLDLDDDDGLMDFSKGLGAARGLGGMAGGMGGLGELNQELDLFLGSFEEEEDEG